MNQEYIQEQRRLSDIAEDALTDAIYSIQQKLGVEWGDLASHFFSDGVVEQKLFDYACAEFYKKGK